MAVIFVPTILRYVVAVVFMSTIFMRDVMAVVFVAMIFMRYVMAVVFMTFLSGMVLAAIFPAFFSGMVFATVLTPLFANMVLHGALHGVPHSAHARDTTLRVHGFHACRNDAQGSNGRCKDGDIRGGSPMCAATARY